MEQEEQEEPPQCAVNDIMHSNFSQEKITCLGTPVGQTLANQLTTNGVKASTAAQQILVTYLSHA